MADFINQYFLEPIRTGSGYNPVNTLVYAGFFVLLAAAFVKIIRKQKLKPEVLLWYVLPYIVLGGLVRALTDKCVYACAYPDNLLFVTPGIYLWITGLFLLSITYLKTYTPHLGWLLVGANLTQLHVTVDWVLYTVPLLALLLTVGALLVYRQLGLKYMGSKLGALALYAHLFEASASFVAIDFLNYGEQHVLAGSLVTATGTGAAIIALKVLILPIVLYLAEDLKDREYIKVLVLIIGLGPGIRDWLTAAASI